MALTHDELCQIAYQFLKRNGFKVCFHDRFVAVTSTGEQPDAMGFRNFASCLIEAKCSRADLLADRKKRFRLRPELGMGDWRFFISEPGIISVEDLPPGWGLLHVVNGKVRKVHGWPQGTVAGEAQRISHSPAISRSNAITCFQPCAGWN